MKSKIDLGKDEQPHLTFAQGINDPNLQNKNPLFPNLTVVNKNSHPLVRDYEERDKGFGCGNITDGVRVVVEQGLGG